MKQRHHSYLLKRRSYRAYGGVIGTLFAGIVLILLAVLGLSLYVGVNAYVQGQFHEAASAAAGAAARSMYDAIEPNHEPKFSPELGQAAGVEAFEVFSTANPVLKQFNPTLTLRQIGSDQFAAEIEGKMKLPLLSYVGLGELTMQAESQARYMQNELARKSEDVFINTQQGAYQRQIPLDMPIYDGKGTDLYINTGKRNSGYHGIQVFVCNRTGSCKNVAEGEDDAGNAMIFPYKEGVIVERKVNGNMERFLYGRFFVDLAFLGVHKGTVIKIIDDGIHDGYSVGGIDSKGIRTLELIPDMTVPTSIRTMHHALICRSGHCNLPQKFVQAGGYG